MEQLYQVESPLKEDIEIMVKGVVYRLPAGGFCENLSGEVVKHWKSLHAFLNFKKMPMAPVKVEEEIVVEQKVESPSIPMARVEEEIVVEAPANPKVGVASRIIKPRVRK